MFMAVVDAFRPIANDASSCCCCSFCCSWIRCCCCCSSCCTCVTAPAVVVVPRRFLRLPAVVSGVDGAVAPVTASARSLTTVVDTDSSATSCCSACSWRKSVITFIPPACSGVWLVVIVVSRLLLIVAAISFSSLPGDRDRRRSSWCWCCCSCSRSRCCLSSSALRVDLCF